MFRIVSVVVLTVCLIALPTVASAFTAPTTAQKTAMEKAWIADHAIHGKCPSGSWQFSAFRKSKLVWSRFSVWCSATGGVWVVEHHKGARWHVVVNGSADVNCKTAPKDVLRDLGVKDCFSDGTLGPTRVG